MTKDEKYILVNLEDESSKKLAESISNKTARKILDYLSNKEEAGAEEIAKELSLPLSTVDYNLKNLKQSKLIEAKHFNWSSRGKRIILYKLAKKLIIIAPRSSILKEELKKIIPLILGIGVVSYAIEVLTKPQQILFAAQKADSEALFASAPSLAQDSIPEVIKNFHYGIWFFVIALIIIIIYLVIKLKKRK